LAETYGLECHGTLWVLKRLWELQLRTGFDLREDIVKLRQRGIRLPVVEVNAFLQDIGQGALSEV
jgi:hypothetical protein